MKSSKMAKKANALKGFLNSMGKKKGEMGMSNPNAFLTKPKKPTNTMPSNKPSFSPNVAPSAGKVYNAPPKTTREMYDYAAKKSASIPTRTMKKGGSFPDLNKDGQVTKADILMGRGVINKPKAQMGMNIMDEAMENATRSIPNSSYKMGGKKQVNPLAAMIKKSKPKMAMGGDFFPQNPLMASKYKGDTLMGQSLKKGGMVKKKKK